MLQWLSTYGGFIQFFLQVAFWIVIAVCAIIATIAFKASVDSRLASDRALMAMYGLEEDAELAEGLAEAAEETGADEVEVDVEKFVD